jgi:DNA-directed RNA polymerase subunit RPC12/RpoP
MNEDINTDSNEIFRCNNCGHDILIKKGTAFFGGALFDCFVCEKCGNKILLQIKNEPKIEKHSNLERNIKKLR